MPAWSPARGNSPCRPRTAVRPGRAPPVSSIPCPSASSPTACRPGIARSFRRSCRTLQRRWNRWCFAAPARCRSHTAARRGRRPILLLRRAGGGADDRRRSAQQGQRQHRSHTGGRGRLARSQQAPPGSHPCRHNPTHGTVSQRARASVPASPCGAQCHLRVYLDLTTGAEIKLKTPLRTCPQFRSIWS